MEESNILKASPALLCCSSLGGDSILSEEEVGVLGNEWLESDEICRAWRCSDPRGELSSCLGIVSTSTGLP